MAVLSTPLEGLPRVPISEFKANPVRYSGGVMVTNHGRDQFVFLPIVDSVPHDLASVKAQLLLLTTVSNPSDVAAELAEVAASRDSERVGDPR